MFNGRRLYQFDSASWTGTPLFGSFNIRIPLVLFDITVRARERIDGLRAIWELTVTFKTSGIYLAHEHYTLLSRKA